MLRCLEVLRCSTLDPAARWNNFFSGLYFVSFGSIRVWLWPWHTCSTWVSGTQREPNFCPPYEGLPYKKGGATLLTRRSKPPHKEGPRPPSLKKGGDLTPTGTEELAEYQISKLSSWSSVIKIIRSDIQLGWKLRLTLLKLSGLIISGNFIVSINQHWN